MVDKEVEDEDDAGVAWVEVGTPTKDRTRSMIAFGHELLFRKLMNW